MPYNATWIEPWMRPLKQARRTKRRSISQINKNSKGENNKMFVSQIVRTSKENTFKRRAPRLRRISASKNWSENLSTKKKSKKAKKSKPNRTRLGSNI